MKALSVRQPWAHLIMIGEKEYEFRSWKTDYRGDLLICSSANPKIKNTIPGHALAVVKLTEIYEVTKRNYRKFGLDEQPDEPLYAWYLTDVRLVAPFPVKGKLHFYEVNDSKIEIVAGDEEITEEEGKAYMEKYFIPYAYRYEPVAYETDEEC